jgi:hypothetical protein
MMAGSIPRLLAFLAPLFSLLLLGQVAVFLCNPRSVSFRLATKWTSHSMIGKHGSIFGIGQHGESCHLHALSTSTTSTYITLIHRGTMVATSIDACPLTKFMKTISIPPPAPICMSAFRSDTIPPCRAAPSVILDEGYRLSRSAHSFFRAVRVFLSGLIDSSAFHNDSLDREVSVIFTSNGPLIYRWESK